MQKNQKKTKSVYYSLVERYLTGFISSPGQRIRSNFWTKDLIYLRPLGQIRGVPMTHHEKYTL